MSRNFNVAPYYDDFDPANNMHRVLFRPGRAVQARELTQSQTILQDQITKFADNIFKQNSPVTGGQVTTNFACYYIKLETTFNNAEIDVTTWEGKMVTDATGTVRARVIAVAAPTDVAGAGDPPTLIVSYKSGVHFTDGQNIYDVHSDSIVKAIATNSTGGSSVAHILPGVFYVMGNFVQVPEGTTILEKYSTQPSKRIGLYITETIHDYVDDSSLLDPAVGASNYQAPGADRYIIGLELTSRPIAFGDDQNFVELVRVEEGTISKLVDGSVYNVIDDYFAKRDFETNGDYVVNDFKLTPKTNDDPTKYTMSVGKGLAYVHGYRMENPVPIDLYSNRARTTKTSNNKAVSIDVGPYFVVDTVHSLDNSTSTAAFDVASVQTIDLHCVTAANVNTTNVNTYNATVVGTGYIRGLVYDYSTSTDANTYVFKAFVNDIQLAAPTGTAQSGGTNTITLPSTYSSSNTSYIGVNISITEGPAVGDFRTITGYNGVTKVATVNTPWTTATTSSSKFVLNFEVKDTDTIVATLSKGTPCVLQSTAQIATAGRDTNGFAVYSNPSVPEMVFKIGSPYVASISDTSYITTHVFRGVGFNNLGDGGVQAVLSYESTYLDVLSHLGVPGKTYSATVDPEFIKEHYTIIVTDKGTNTAFNTGDIIDWCTTDRTVTMDNDSSKATFVSATLSPFTATIIAKVQVQNANDSNVIKTKTLITGNTTNPAILTSYTNIVNSYTYVDLTPSTAAGQVYINHNGLVTAGSKQKLYLVDVKSIVKIVDSKNSSLDVTASMITNAAYDITSKYNFDNGQRDSYYDHASITLKPGQQQPVGNILVIVNHYQHGGGDGYFSLNSYGDEYTTIPSFTSTHGITYSLRDCFDFRPSLKNGQSDFVFRFKNEASTSRSVFLPVADSVLQTDYSYYLGRKDKLVLTKDRIFNIIEGAPSLEPIFPAEPDGSLVIAKLTHNPYTGYIPTETPEGTISDLNIERVSHKRYTMQDIAGIEKRINDIEYYSALSLLEQKTSSLQVPDAYGLNRFKNGIMVDDFSGYSTADTTSGDYAVAINRRTKTMSASESLHNFPLKNLAEVYSLGSLSATAHSSLSYKISQDNEVKYYSLPFTTESAILQKFASRTVNVNPFSATVKSGTASLSPNIDTTPDVTQAPALLITSGSLNIFKATNSNLDPNIYDTRFAFGDWKGIVGTETTKTTHLNAWGPYGAGTMVDTYQTETRESYAGNYSKISNTYSVNDNYITDISVLPFIRKQETVLRTSGLLINTFVDVYFDGKNVNNFVRRCNAIQLTPDASSGSWSPNDYIGYVDSGGVPHLCGQVVSVETFTNGDVRLWVAKDGLASITKYTEAGGSTGTIQNMFFNSDGTYQTGSRTAWGTVYYTGHWGGQIVSGSDTTHFTLSSLLKNATYPAGSAVAGAKMYIVNGNGAGQSATIQSYDAVTGVITLSTPLEGVTAGSVYSLMNEYFKTDEVGQFNGIFCIQPNMFYNGQRILRVDNSEGNKGAETTWAETTFYAQNLKLGQQQLDFGASPSGAKGVITTTSTQTIPIKSEYVVDPRNDADPVAQTFMFSKENYPNGVFLSNVRLFFKTKPVSLEDSPVTLSIVNTQNGYPTGETLDHSIVTVEAARVRGNQSFQNQPHYLDSKTYTQFNFSAPVYIQPGVLYAFVIHSSSNEYTLWTANKGDTALASSTKVNPTDPTPSQITMISSAPYIGSLFVSQNAITWTADQNQDLMMVVNRCKFDITTSPQINYVVPKGLPERTIVEDAITHYYTPTYAGNSDVLVDAFNVSTTDFTPTNTGISYSYNATLASSSLVDGSAKSINPGKFGTAMIDDIYLSDGKGERILLNDSKSSFNLYATLTSTDDAVSPIISDAGLTVHTVKWNINNGELSNSIISVTNGGSGYNVSCTSVTISSSDLGTTAVAVPVIVDGVITAIHLTDGGAGSGYITTPTISISDANSTPGTGATAIVSGETSSSGGNALARYITKKVVLDAGFDSGDLNVYLTAYRPSGTDINVYYKILNRNDTQDFQDGVWQLMTKTKSSGSAFSKTRDDLIEYSFAPGTGGVDQGYVTYTSNSGTIYNNFSQFAIKITLTTQDNTFVPVISELRAIALPANVNTTF
jgi:hypothetical protein